jgi:quercetin dioxygenase-like cupin family protein
MSKTSPHGEMGQKYLASGINIAMRLWEDQEPDDNLEISTRDYETVGYVIEGKAELHLEGQMVILEKGDSWVVPKGASHGYKILETFTAVEATTPPAQAHGRDDA